MKTFFDGSAAQAAAALVDSGSLSDEELARLSSLIDRARDMPPPSCVPLMRPKRT